MHKITLEDKHNNRMLSLYIADDAFDGRALPEETKNSILRIIAEKMFKKLPGKQIIYISKITLPNAEQTYLSFEYNHPANDTGRILRATIKDMEPSDQTDQIEVHNLSASGISYSLPRNTERDQYRKILLTRNVCTEAEVDDLVSYFTDDPVQRLQSIKQEIFNDVPENAPEHILSEMHSFVDRTINAGADVIRRERAIVVKWVQDALDYSYAYYTAILPIASQLYDAAKSYYLDMWKNFGKNFAEFQKEREAFNKLFNGIAYIDEDFNLSSIAETMDALRLKHARTLEDMISELVHTAYTNNKSAFTHLTNKLHPNSTYMITGTLIPWSYKFTFTQETNDLYQKYAEANKDVDSIPSGGLSRLMKTIHDAENDVRARAAYTKNEKKDEIASYFARQKAAEQKAQHQNSSFFQRNKGTIISLCIGAAIAAGAALAIAFAPISMPTIAIAGIIAGAVVAIMAVSTIIGRIIDKCKPAVKQPVSASPEESQRLLHDFDRALEPESRGNPTPFLAKRSALSSNSLLQHHPAAATSGGELNVSQNTLKL